MCRCQQLAENQGTAAGGIHLVQMCVSQQPFLSQAVGSDMRNFYLIVSNIMCIFPSFLLILS